jgi:hypothetical protein
MRIFYDCEFLYGGKTIEPISIDIVAEDGPEQPVNGDLQAGDRRLQPARSPGRQC